MNRGLLLGGARRLGRRADRLHCRLTRGLRGLGTAAAHGPGLFCRRLHPGGPQNHRLLEIGRRGGRLRARLLDEFKLVLAELDNVVVLQEMLLDRVAVDQRAVGAAKVLHERIVQDGDDHRVLAADRQIVDLDVVMRLAADRGALLGKRDLLEHQAVHAEYQFRHSWSLRLF